MTIHFTCVVFLVVTAAHTNGNSDTDPTVPPKVNPAQVDELLKGYDKLFTGLGCLPGEHTIEIDPSYTPVVHSPRRVPVALKEQIKEELQRMENAGVVVKQKEPTDWVNSMVTVIKPEKIRVCIDPRDLNRAIKREHYPMKTTEDMVAEMSDAKVFSVLDATSGYWQMKLDEKSSKLCTFNTLFGRYRFTRLPSGIKSAPEVFQKKMSQILENIDMMVLRLGVVLYQEGQPVEYASRALTPTQQKYAQIEKETLVITFGTTKFHQFLFGKEVVVTSDHKPLE